jgi:hypothetical protein
MEPFCEPVKAADAADVAYRPTYKRDLSPTSQSGLHLGRGQLSRREIVGADVRLDLHARPTCRCAVDWAVDVDYGTLQTAEGRDHIGPVDRVEDVAVVLPTPDECSCARSLAGGVVDIGCCSERRADMPAASLGPSALIHGDEERIVEALQDHTDAHRWRTRSGGGRDK